MQTLSIAWLLVFVTVTLPPQPDERAAEMARLQGKFERFFTNPAGAKFRAVRETSGDQSIVTTFDDMGSVVESHTSTFNVGKRGPVRVLSYANLVVTAGPAKGHVEAATHSYIYRYDGDVFSEVWGLLEGDSSPPRMFQWRRVTEEK